jgi:hypothetical protein
MVGLGLECSDDTPRLQGVNGKTGTSSGFVRDEFKEVSGKAWRVRFLSPATAFSSAAGDTRSQSERRVKLGAR